MPTSASESHRRLRKPPEVYPSDYRLRSSDHRCNSRSHAEIDKETQGSGKQESVHVDMEWDGTSPARV